MRAIVGFLDGGRAGDISGEKLFGRLFSYDSSVYC